MLFLMLFLIRLFLKLFLELFLKLSSKKHPLQYYLWFSNMVVPVSDLDLIG